MFFNMTIKKLLVFASIFLQLMVSAQTITLTQPPNGGNQKSTVTQWMGIGSVTVTYRGPDVHDNNGKDRRGKIWGNLVHNGFADLGFGPSMASPWRAGSNEITSIQFSHAMKVNGKTILPGTYGLMLALDSLHSWTWIFSSVSTSWGTYYYNEEDDVLRIPANPENAPYSEWLTYTFEQRLAASCQLWLNWEDKRIGFRIELPNANDLYVAKMKEELVGYAGFDSRNWIRAAKFCLDSMVQMEKGLWFIDRALDTTRMNGIIDANALRIKYELLLQLSKVEEAKLVLDQLTRLNGLVVTDLYLLGRNVLKKGYVKEASAIFAYNKDKFPQEKYWTNIGLALTLTAQGKNTEAIACWEQVIKNTPPDRIASIPEYEAQIKKIKDK